jgi:hypothetical protein
MPQVYYIYGDRSIHYIEPSSGGAEGGIIVSLYDNAMNFVNSPDLEVRFGHYMPLSEPCVLLSYGGSYGELYERLRYLPPQVRFGKYAPGDENYNLINMTKSDLANTWLEGAC